MGNRCCSFYLISVHNRKKKHYVGACMWLGRCPCLGPAWAPGLGHLPCLPGPLLGPWAWTWAPAWAWAPGLPPLPGLLPTPWPLPCLGPFSALPQATRAQAPGRPKQAQAWAQTGAQA